MEKKLFGLFRVSLKRFVVKVIISLNNVSDNFELRVSRERHLARKHNIEDDSERPDVDFIVVALGEHFWGNVVGLKIR